MRIFKRLYNLILICVLLLLVFIFSITTVIEILIVTPVYYIISGKLYLLERDGPIVILLAEKIYNKLKL